MAKCANCGAELQPNARFCVECGEKVADKKFCPQCGMELSEDAKFCSACGARIDTDVSTTDDDDINTDEEFSEIRESLESLKRTTFHTKSLSFTMGGAKNLFLRLNYYEEEYSWHDDSDIKYAIEKGKDFPSIVTDALYDEIDDTTALLGGFNTDSFDGSESVYITLHGIFFNNDYDEKFFKYEDISEIKISNDSLIVSTHDDSVTIHRTDYITTRIISELRAFLIKICSDTDGGSYYQYETDEELIKKTVAKYIHNIGKGYTGYDYEQLDENGKRLQNALSTYAQKVKRSEVAGFVDTTLFSNGKDGLLFSVDGISFDYAFSKIFISYSEIVKMEIRKKTLHFIGNFENAKGHEEPTIDSMMFNIQTLKSCIEEIQMYVSDL